MPGTLANLGTTDSDSASDIGSHVSTSGLLKNSPFLSGGNGPSSLSSLSGTNGRIGSFKIGDRVLVNASSGTKLGTLMFLGEGDTLSYLSTGFLINLFCFCTVLFHFLNQAKLTLQLVTGRALNWMIQ